MVRSGTEGEERCRIEVWYGLCTGAWVTHMPYVGRLYKTLGIRKRADLFVTIDESVFVYGTSLVGYSHNVQW